MSHNITVEGGKSVRLPTAGKYCDRDIVVTATGSGGGGGSEMAGALADKSITEFISDNCASLGEYAFRACKNLRMLIAPNAKSVGTYALYQCSALKSLTLPSVTSIATNAFRELTNAEVIDLPNLTAIPTNGFYGCRGLKALILRSNTMVTLASTNAFYQCYRILGTKNSGYNPNGEKIGFIYVHKALLSDEDETMDYRRATNWSSEDLVTQLRPSVATAADLASIDGSVYDRAFVEDEDCVYIYDGSAWAKEV